MIHNPFIYQKIKQAGMLLPDIAAILQPSYAQCYEDIIVESLLLADIIKDGNSHFVFIEIGANHPVCTSSSFLFKEKYNMPCVLVEANPVLSSELKKHRPTDTILEFAVVDNESEFNDFYISDNNETSSLDKNFVLQRTPGIKKILKVPTIRVNKVLEIASKIAPKLILSLDVEAYDLPILKDIDWENYKPLLIIVEPSEDYSPGSTNDIIQYLTARNYSIVASTSVNLIFKINSK